MLESFKINCFPLNRAIRITINLPKNYNNTNRYYPVVYVLDGQNAFNDKDSFRGVSLSLQESIDKLESIGKYAIYICIASAIDQEKREKEYKESILSDFILNEIHPLLKTRYRMNNYIYSLGCSKASYQALKLGYSSEFKGSILLSPVGDFKNFNKPTTSKLVFLYAGKNELDGACLKCISQIKEINDLVHVFTDDSIIHSEESWKTKLFQALNFLIL